MKITTRCLLLVSLYLMSPSTSLKGNNFYFVSPIFAQEKDFDDDEEFDFDGKDESLFDDGDSDADFSEDPDEEFGDFAEDSADDTDFLDFNDDELEQADTGENDAEFGDFEDDVDVVDESSPVANDLIEAEPSVAIEEPQEVEDEPSAITDTVVDESEFDEPSLVTEPVDTFVAAEPTKSFNTAYENQLFNIYSKYYNYPVAGADWDSLTGNRKSEVYVIQKGDTLWDISSTFFGDGNYWPKIWSVNGRITNPHLIDVGNNILFNLGNINTPPSFSVSEDGSIPVNQGSSGGALGDNLVASNAPVKIPESKYKRAPVLRNLPNSLPAWARSTDLKPAEFVLVKSKADPNRGTEVPVTYMMKTNELPVQGEVMEAEAKERFAMAGQYVYVNLVGNSNAGRYLVAKSLGRVKPKKDSGELTGPYGFIYEIQGEITVQDSLKKQGGKQLYRAYVESSYKPVSKGAVLLNEDLVNVELTNSGDFNLTPGQVIGGSTHEGSRLLIDGMFAFVNRGSADGMEVDDKVMFISQRQVRKSKTKIKGPLFKVGEGQVVDVSDNVSTVLVTKVISEIYVGDYIGEPEFDSVSPSGSGSSDDDFGDDDFGGDDGSDDSGDDFGDDGFGDEGDDGSDDDFGGDDEEGFDDESGDSSDESFEDDDFEDSGSDDGDFDDEDFGDSDDEGFDDDDGGGFDDESFDDSDGGDFEDDGGDFDDDF